MALLSIRAGRDEEQINVEAQQTQDQAQQVADQNEVNEMHQEASDIRSNAIESGLLQIAEGATQIAGAAASASAQAGAGSDAVQQSVGAASAQSTLSAYSGAATLLGAASTTVAGFGKAGQTDDEAQIASYKAAADRAQQMSSEATQGQTDAKSIISNAIQFYQEYEQTKSQIEAAALYKA